MDENSWLRLTRYVTGEGSEEERRATEHWIAAAPDRAELVSRLRTGWERAGGSDDTFDVERAWGEVARRKTVRSGSLVADMAGLERKSRVPFAQFGRLRARRWPSVLAASFTIAIGAGTAWWATRAGWHLPATIAEGPTRTVTTLPGQIADVYLSDGTHVRLAAASSLRFPTKFGGARRVYLEGEGFFDVVHDPANEFTVRTSNAIARDIGTRFNVRAAAGEGTEIVVAEGAVAMKPATGSLSGTPDSAVLTPSDLGRVDSAGAVTVAHSVNVADYLAWMDGSLVFVDTPLREVLPRLNRWYGVAVTVGDPRLADTRLTATLEANSLSEALRRLSAVLDVRVERHGPSDRTIVLSPQHPAQGPDAP